MSRAILPSGIFTQSPELITFVTVESIQDGVVKLYILDISE